ncbi:hypothetical protein [Ekhidna sp.]|uniref:hypothetical protein n=1 Tax=Ekhidna sp. TaxID=2608089 RepID=UPI003BAB254F
MKERIEKLIDEVLKSEPSFELSKDFKDQVIVAIRKKERAVQRRLYSWMLMGTLVIFGFGYATISYFLPSVLESLGSANSLSDKLIPGAVLVCVAVLVIQYLDKRLVKERMLKT